MSQSHKNSIYNDSDTEFLEKVTKRKYKMFISLKATKKSLLSSENSDFFIKAPPKSSPKGRTFGLGRKFFIIYFTIYSVLNQINKSIFCHFLVSPPMRGGFRRGLDILVHTIQIFKSDFQTLHECFFAFAHPYARVIIFFVRLFFALRISNLRLQIS